MSAALKAKFVIVYEDTNQPVGWPSPLEFDTQKEARKRMQKIAHQMPGVSLVIRKISLAAGVPVAG